MFRTEKMDSAPMDAEPLKKPMGEVKIAQSDSGKKDGMDIDTDKPAKEPEFPALTAQQMTEGKAQYQRVQVPPHRMAALKAQWMEIYKPIVEHMKLQIRFNPKKKCVELRTSAQTESGAAMQKSVDFVRAFCLGFAVRDAIALLRLEDLYIDSFDINDVKTLSGEHLARAIGRIAGQAGKTKYTIENTTKTRIVLADTHIHILGSFESVKVAKTAISKLIMGSPPGKIYTQMRGVSARMKERF